MNADCAVAIVIPCYRAERHIAEVLRAIPPWVRWIVVVDDASPDASAAVVEAARDPRVTLIRHAANQGVGGAMATGYRHALSLGADIVVKMDADGQMDPAQLERLIAPLLQRRADYAKGNRFANFSALSSMPRARLFGNSILSFLVKAASGYWSLLDPTNGYTAIHRSALARLDLARLARRYFFECDMLMRLNLTRAVVVDVHIPARYRGESSSLSIAKAALEFPPRLLAGLVRRLFLLYFIYDFNLGSLYMLAGVPLVSFGTIFGIAQWIDSAVTGVVRSAGTVMLVVLPFVLGFQLLLQALAVDLANEPKVPLVRQDEDRRYDQRGKPGS